MNIQCCYPVILIALLSGCSEGGTGGTGGISPPPIDISAAPTTIAGHANKGPLSAASDITVIQLDTAGIAGENLTTTTTASNFGDYTFNVSVTGPVLVTSTGRYFSEIAGTTEEIIRLSMIINPTEASEIRNINLLTTLATPRIQMLMVDGISVDQAIVMAETEVLLGFNDTLGSIDNTTGFTNLLIIASLQDDIDEAGNGYLLAISSLFEQVAQTRATDNGLNPAENIQMIIDDVAVDLADDGMMSQPVLLAELLTAMRAINPDEILLNLFLLEPSFQADVLAGEAIAEASSAVCSILRGDLVCSDADSNAAQATLPATTLIADLDRFIDTDGDGTVNADDLDDDDDGIPDADDDTPYGD